MLERACESLVCRCGGDMVPEPEEDWDFMPHPNAWRCTVCNQLVHSTIVRRPLEEVARAIEDLADDDPMLEVTLVQDGGPTIH